MLATFVRHSGHSTSMLPGELRILQKPLKMEKKTTTRMMLNLSLLQNSASNWMLIMLSCPIIGGVLATHLALYVPLTLRRPWRQLRSPKSIMQPWENVRLFGQTQGDQNRRSQSKKFLVNSCEFHAQRGGIRSMTAWQLSTATKKNWMRWCLLSNCLYSKKPNCNSSTITALSWDQLPKLWIACRVTKTVTTANYCQLSFRLVWSWLNWSLEDCVTRLRHCMPLVYAVSNGFKERFGDFLKLSPTVTDAVMASVAHPFFKLWWTQLLPGPVDEKSLRDKFVHAISLRERLRGASQEHQQHDSSEDKSDAFFY